MSAGPQARVSVYVKVCGKPCFNRRNENIGFEIVKATVDSCAQIEISNGTYWLSVCLQCIINSE